MRVLVALAVALAPLTALAGEPGVLLVNMTPDAASSKASRTCVKTLEAQIEDWGPYVEKMGETKVRKLVGKTAGEPFLEWPAEPLREVIRPGGDAAILVDCRPELSQLDILVVTDNAGAAVILQLRDVSLDKKTLRWVSSAVVGRALARWGTGRPSRR